MVKKFLLAALTAIALVGAPTNASAQSWPIHECYLTCGSPWLRIYVGGGWIESGVGHLEGGATVYGPEATETGVKGMKAWIQWSQSNGKVSCSKTTYISYNASCSKDSVVSCGAGTVEGTWYGDTTIDRPNGYLPGYFWYRTACNDSAEN